MTAVAAREPGESAARLPADSLRHRAAVSPARRAYVFLDEHGQEKDVLTYGELHSRALGVAAWLAGHCVPGDRALLVFPQGHEFIAAFFGCLYAQVIAVPVRPPRRNRVQDATLGIAADCGPAAILSVSSMLGAARLALEPACGQLPGLPVDQVPPDPGFRPRPCAGGAIAFLQYTSGSTAAPKGVMVSHGNLAANQLMIQRAFGHDENSAIVGWTPFFHDQGLIGNVLQPLHIGATCIMMSPMSFIRWPLGWLSAISRYRAHTSGGPNFAFDACVARAARGGMPDLDLSSWKVAFNGAEPVQPDTLRRFAETFAPYGFSPSALYPCYGLAEATLMVTGSRKGRGPRVIDADPEALGRGRFARPARGRGRPLAGSGLILAGEDVRIVDPGTRRPCAAHQVGEVWVAGDHVAQGYWRQPAISAGTFAAQCDGEAGRRYLRTGDLGLVIDGELYVVGRLKDLMIIRGRNYYPQDIERTVQLAHPALQPAGCAAFSVPGGDGERLVVVQEVRRGQRLTADLADAAASIRAAVVREHQLSLGDLVLTAPGRLPKTTSGKIRRAAARERYLEAGFQ